MIRPEQIPDKVIRKALHAYISIDCDTPEEAMRAAIIAALAAWPKAEERTSGHYPNGIGKAGATISSRIVLPLPQEQRDAGGEG